MKDERLPFPNERCIPNRVRGTEGIHQIFVQKPEEKKTNKSDIRRAPFHE